MVKYKVMMILPKLVIVNQGFGQSQIVFTKTLITFLKFHKIILEKKEWKDYSLL